MRVTVNKFYIPIFFGFLRVVICSDLAIAAKRVNYDPGRDVSKYDAFTYPDHTKKGFTRYTVYIKPKVTPGTIAHEAVHLVNYMHIDRGMHLDTQNDEAQAYITGWVVKKIYRALDKWGKSKIK